MADEESTSVSTKRCSKCGKVLAASMFSPDRRSPTGLQPACKRCASEAKKKLRIADPGRYRSAARAYYAANRNSVLESNARSRDKHAEKIKAHKRAAYRIVRDDPEYKARRKAYVLSTKEAKREYDRQYRNENHAKVIDRAREWIRANPEKRRSILMAYGARRRSQKAAGDPTAKIHAWVVSATKVCYWCGRKCDDGYHVDHYVPLSRGGMHVVSNLVIACPSCNLRKSAKDPYEFAASVGRLF